VLQRPNLAHYSSMCKPSAHFTLHWPNWGICNPLHHYKLTTAQPVALPITPSNRNAPKPLTCIFIGSVIAFAKANFIFLETWHQQSGRLFHKAPSCLPSSSHVTNLSPFAITDHQLLCVSGPTAHSFTSCEGVLMAQVTWKHGHHSRIQVTRM